MSSSILSEDALKHIEHMPFTISDIKVRLSRGQSNLKEFVYLSGDRVYACIDETLYVYSLRKISFPMFASYPLGDDCYQAEIVDNRLYLGSTFKFFVFEVTNSLT